MTWSSNSIQLTLGLLFTLSSAIDSIAAHGDHHAAPLPAGSPPILPPRLVIGHIILQLVSWGILLPAGVILGVARSKLHAPLQSITGLLISLPASALPHLSSRHPYPQNLHASLGSTVVLVLLAQISAGIFLKTHWFQSSAARLLVRYFHSILGKLFPILCWIQILLGGIASLSFCYGDHLGQCLAHFIMGASFIGYGILMLSMLEFGKAWLKTHQVSQEYLDCCVITTWGVFNTFTEHGFFFSAGWHWSHKDLQHTFLGVVWACAGGLGIHLSKNARRSVIPGLVIIVTGWAFQSHQQSLELSTKVHGAFGFTLIAAGFTKTIGVLRQPAIDDSQIPSSHLEPFDHLTPLLLTISGTMFMSATEEQLLLITSIGMDHATYVLCQVSTGCLIYLYTNLMISLYKTARRTPTLDDSPLEASDNNKYSLEGHYENLSMENLLLPRRDYSSSFSRPHRVAPP